MPLNQNVKKPLAKTLVQAGYPPSGMAEKASDGWFGSLILASSSVLSGLMCC